ncbi:MAG: nucleotidyltransferase family protein [Methanoregula sp.]|nr:nucleotidyltransferase family protein [Methanoregula sp.]
MDEQLPKYMPKPDIYHLVASKKDEIAVLAARYGASHIRVFGSVARHTAGENSDIDFLVELEPGRTLFDLGGLSYDLEQLLGKHVDVCTVNLLRDQVRNRILAEAIPL